MPVEIEEFVFEELNDIEEDEERKNGNSEFAEGKQEHVKKTLDEAASYESPDREKNPEKEKNSAIVIDKEAIKRELQEIIETTKKQALEEARIIKEQAKKEGFELGYKEGYEKGLKDAKGVFDNIIAEYTRKMQEAIEKLVLTAKEISKKYDELESVATDMVLDIARKVISTELKTNRDAINSMVKDAIGLAESKKLKIKLNPEDAKLLDKEALDAVKEIEVVEDKELKKGSVIIEEENGNIIDASVDTKLDQVKKSMVNE